MFAIGSDSARSESLAAGSAPLMTPVTPHELLLRRYSPTNPNHVTRDEGNGDLVLNWSALEFDEDGCSVYREEILVNDGLSRAAILEGPYTGIAITTAARVEQFTYTTGTTTVPPFVVVASPRTDEPPLPTDRAHASIRGVDDHGLSVRHFDKACRRHLCGGQMFHREDCAEADLLASEQWERTTTDPRATARETTETEETL